MSDAIPFKLEELYQGALRLLREHGGPLHQYFELGKRRIETGQQQRGVVVFQIVNIEEDATRHFVNDFQLTNRSVVMLTRQNGKDLQWRRLDKVWEKISDDDAYKGYISENLAACLQELEAGPS